MGPNTYRSHAVLILNRPNITKNDSFYKDLFRIPEILNRLRQYRDLLSENNIPVPLWVYGLNQGIKSLADRPQASVLNLLTGLGLFDRWTSKNGWPRYIIGSDPFIPLITGERNFEEHILLSSKGSYREDSQLYLYKAGSYYNSHTESFYLASLHQKGAGSSLKEILSNWRQALKKNNQDAEEWIFQLLSPHEEGIVEDLKRQAVSPRDFMEWNQDLKWLWPVWKRAQMQSLRKKQGFGLFSRRV